MRLDPRFVAALIAVLCGGVSFSAAQRLRPNQPGQPSDQTKPTERQRRPAPDLNTDPALLEAAKTAPVPPDQLKRLIPEKLGVFKRKSVDGALQSLGPALYTEIHGELEGAPDRTIYLSMIDSAGLPPDVGPKVAPIAPGKRVVDGDFVREGFEVDGYPAILEDGGPQGTRRMQVQVSPRLRITLDSAKATRDELVAAVRAIDLHTAATLTTKKAEAAPATPAAQPQK